MAAGILDIDPEAIRMQGLAQGLLGLGSNLVAASAPSTDPGGFGRGLGAGLQAFQQGVQGARQQAMQQAVQNYQLEKMKQEMAQREAAAKYLESLGQPSQQVVQAAMANGAGPTVGNAQALASAPGISPEQIALYKAAGPEAALKMMADRQAKLDEWNLKRKFEPEISGATEAAKNAPLLARREGELGQDFMWKPRTAAAEIRATTQPKVELENALTPGAVSRAVQTAAGQERATLPYWQQKEDYKNLQGAPGKAFDMSSKLADDFRAEVPVKTFREAVPVMNSMREAIGRNTKAADLNLVYGLAKIMDPNSVVREGEVLTVSKTASLPDWLLGNINSLNGGGRLTPETRAALMTEAESRFGQFQQAHDRTANLYTDRAKRYGLNPSDVVITPTPSASGGEEKKPSLIEDSARRKAIQRELLNRQLRGEL